MHALACASAIATQQALVHIDEPEQGIRYPEVDAIKLRPTPLHARDIGVQYNWQPSAGLNNNQTNDPIFTYDRPQEYYIHITTRSGCNLTDTVAVRLFDRCDIHVPNAFSPNDDGKNDTFFPFLIDVADYHTRGTQKTANTVVAGATDDFHVYRVDWTPYAVRGFVDGTQYFEFVNENTGFTTWPFNKNFFLILNIAVGGNWGGAQGVDNSIFPATMLVDYVRVYKMIEQ